MEQSALGHVGDIGRDTGPLTFPLPPEIVTERDVGVRMRDGVHLAVTVYRPAGAGRVPVVMCVTAYGKDFGPAEYSTLPRLHGAGMEVGTMRISDAAPWEGPDPAFWVPAGYAVVVANARGYYDSEGEAGIWSDVDATDYHDLIEWAGTQPWSTGAVGLNGVSYLAINQWMVASLTKPAHLKAIVPWEGASDLLRDAVHHGGIPETRFRRVWMAGSLARGAGEDIVATGPAKLDRMMERPFPLENIDVPALICASWSDHGLHSRGSFEAFRRIASRDKWLYIHGGKKWEEYYSAEALEWQKSFLDHFLKGEANGFEHRPRVRLAVLGSKYDVAVRSADDWPLKGVKYFERYLDLDRRRLVTEVPPAEQSLAYDAEAKSTVDFDLAFARPTEVVGPMALRLWVAARDADDLDLFVAVRKVDRDGAQVDFAGKDGHPEGAVALGWLRVSKRRLDPASSTPERPYLSQDRTEKVRPGEVVPVDIEILPSGTRFEAGEALRLSISGRDIHDYPGFGHDDPVNQGLHEIFSGPERRSRLLVPVVAAN